MNNISKWNCHLFLLDFVILEPRDYFLCLIFLNNQSQKYKALKWWWTNRIMFIYIHENLQTVQFVTIILLNVFLKFKSNPSQDNFIQLNLTHGEVYQVFKGKVEVDWIVFLGDFKMLIKLHNLLDDVDVIQFWKFYLGSRLITIKTLFIIYLKRLKCYHGWCATSMRFMEIIILPSQYIFIVIVTESS